MKIRNFASVLEANGICRPTGFWAQMTFDRKWAKAQKSYECFAESYAKRIAQWAKIRNDLETTWGYQSPSLAEVDGLISLYFHTPAEAVEVFNRRLCGLNATDLRDHEAYVTGNFRSWWNAEIQVTAKTKDSTLVILRKSKGKTPNLDEIKSFATSVTAGQETVIKDDQTPVWVACRPENVKDYLKFFTRNQTCVDFK